MSESEGREKAFVCERERERRGRERGGGEKEEVREGGRGVGKKGGRGGGREDMV